MSAIHYLPKKDDKVPKETLSTSTPTPEPEPARPSSVPWGSVSVILLVILIAAAAWFFFTNLFTYPNSLPPPISRAPSPSAKSTEPVFFPTDALSQPQAETPVPAATTEKEPDANKDSTDTATQVQLETPDPELMSATTTAKPRRVRTPRPVAQIPPTPAPRTKPRIKATVATSKPSLPPRAPEPAPLPSRAIQKNAEPTPIISASANPQLNDDKTAHLTSRAAVPELKTSIAPYPETASDTDAPVDLALISMTAPPKPVIKNSAHQNSGVVVIVNKANAKAFDRSDISNIYRDRITRWPSGERILVLNLPLDSGERQRFTAEILDMSALRAATEASNRTITNRTQNEYHTKSADVVVSYVEQHQNAIGYVPAAAVSENSNVRVVYSIP